MTRTPEEEAARASKLYGWSKLYNADGSFRWGKQALDQTGHAVIALGASLLVIPLALWARWRPALCALVGAVVGFLALTTREVIQGLTSGSLHLADRLLDVSLGPLVGALGGLACYYAVARWRRRHA